MDKTIVYSASLHRKKEFDNARKAYQYCKEKELIIDIIAQSNKGYVKGYVFVVDEFENDYKYCYEYIKSTLGDYTVLRDWSKGIKEA